MENVSVLIGIIGTIAGFVLSYFTFARNAKKDNVEDGKASGTVLTEIGYIKANTDDIKRKQEKQDEKYTEMAERVTAVESSAKQAHRRIDRLEGREYSEGAHHEQS